MNGYVYCFFDLRMSLLFIRIKGQL